MKSEQEIELMLKETQSSKNIIGDFTIIEYNRLYGMEKALKWVLEKKRYKDE